jgi:hypothetical protein
MKNARSGQGMIPGLIPEGITIADFSLESHHPDQQGWRGEEAGRRQYPSSFPPVFRLPKPFHENRNHFIFQSSSSFCGCGIKELENRKSVGKQKVLFA